MKSYTCKRCNHVWYPRTPMKPVTCANPKCRSPLWDRERKVKKNASS